MWVDLKTYDLNTRPCDIKWTIKNYVIFETNKSFFLTHQRGFTNETNGKLHRQAVIFSDQVFFGSKNWISRPINGPKIGRSVLIDQTMFDFSNNVQATATSVKTRNMGKRQNFTKLVNSTFTFVLWFLSENERYFYL